MNAHPNNMPCPSEGQLKVLLAGKLNERDKADCETHVKQCEICRCILRSLSGDSDEWLKVRVDVTSNSIDEPDSACLGQMKALRGSIDNSIEFPGAPSPEAPLGRVATYDIIKELGEGGMGVVFLAVDSQLEQKVALKVLKPALAADPVQRERFGREGRAVAKVKNDHVVKVHSAGSSADFNLPYLVMEYIEGESLSELVERLKASQSQSSGLSPEECADIIRQAASGLSAAHQQGLVHRDVKPSNLMRESATGRIKVTDFGLARSVETNSDQVTRHGAVIGTVHYMSPEHVLDPKSIEQRSDVFSLGSVLYELMTGEKPFVGQELKIKSQIVNDSVRSPRKLNDAIARDLETICLKCMRKDPKERYASAGALADDLDRFLNRQAILARPVSSSEKLWLWCCRNPRVAALTSGLLIVITVLSLGYSFSLRASYLKEETARTRADHRSAQARQAVDDMYTQVAEKWLADQPQMQSMQRDFLLKALNFYKEFASEEGDDPSVQLQAALAQRRVGDISYTLGDTANAESAYRQTIELESRLMELEDKPVTRLELAVTQTNLALLLANDTRLPEAKSMYLIAQSAFELLVDQYPDVHEYRVQLANCLSGLSQAYFGLAEPLDSERCCRRAIELQQELVREFPNEPRYQRDLATSFIHLGLALEQRGQVDEALSSVEQGAKVQTVLVANSPTNPGNRFDMANSLTHKSRLQAMCGQLPTALETLERVDDQQARLTLEFPAVPKYREELVATRNAMGSLLLEMGRLHDAEASYRKALDILSSLISEFPQAAHHRMNFAGITNNLCGIMKRTGRSEDARKSYEDLIAEQERLVKQFPAQVGFQTGLAISCNNFGSLLEGMGQPANAEKSLRRSIELYSSLRERTPNAIIHQRNHNGSVSNLCRVLAAMGKFDEAHMAFKKTIADQQAIVKAQPKIPEYQSELAHTYNNFGTMLLDSQKLADAEIAFREALNIRDLLVSKYPKVAEYRRDLAASHNNLGEFYDRTGQRDRIQQPLDSAIRIREQLVSDYQKDIQYAIDLCGSYGNFGRQLRLKGENLEAIKWFDKVIDRAGKILKENPSSAESRRILRNAYASRALASDDLGNYDLALADLESALGLNDSESSEVRLRVQRTFVLLHKEELAKVVSEAEVVASSRSLSGQFAYDLACVLSLVSKKRAQQDTATTDTAAEVERLQSRAVELLMKSASLDFLSRPDAIKHSERDSDLDPIRARDDFKALMKELHESQTTPTDQLKS